MDRLTKYANFISLAHPYNAKDVAGPFVKEVVKLHGIPRSIVSDRDRLFVSNFWQELFKLSGTTLAFSFAYHPKIDGQTEVVNRSLETYLRCFSSNKPKNWSHWLAWAKYWFNTNFNQSIGMSSFRALYGRDPPTLFKLEDVKSNVEEVNEHIRNRNAVIEELKVHLIEA